MLQQFLERKSQSLSHSEAQTELNGDLLVEHDRAKLQVEAQAQRWSSEKKFMLEHMKQYTMMKHELNATILELNVKFDKREAELESELAKLSKRNTVMSRELNFYREQNDLEENCNITDIKD